MDSVTVPKSCIIAVLMMVSSTLAQTLPQSRPSECSLTNVTENVLKDDVISKYPPWERPVRDVGEAIEISLTFALSKINDIIEREKILKLTGYLSVRWFDQLRIWNTTYPLNCVVYVVVPSEAVWLPDVAMMNGNGRYALMNLPGEKVRIHSDGFTIYSPGGTFIVYCEFDLRMFPFDIQLCAVKFESWRYTRSFVKFYFGKPNIRIYEWLDNEQWELVNTSQTLSDLSYMDPENSFDRVEFYLCLKRKSFYYVTSVIIPGLIISLCQVAVFALPLDESNKVYILFTCLLAYLVFLLMIVGDMPRSSEYVPLLTIYVSISMALITFSIMGEGLAFTYVRRAATAHPQGPGNVPAWLYSLCKASAWGMRLYLYFPESLAKDNSEVFQVETNSQSNNHVMTGSSSNNNNNTQSQTPTARFSRRMAKRRKAKEIKVNRRQWRCVATTVDRLTLVIYTVAVIISPIILFGVIPNVGTFHPPCQG